MNILIVGGSGTFLNNILIKCRKEGHKVSVLTGSRFSDKSDYEKCFEVYPFPYDAVCLNEIFESVAPDVTIFMGAYDKHFNWKNEESDSVAYTASLVNVLMGYIMRGKGRFIYLSSHEVFGRAYDEPVTEDTITSPNGFRAQAILQGENLCENYRVNRDMDIVTVRMDHLYGIPENRQDVRDACTSMCLEALEDKTIHYSKKSCHTLLYEKDAVEALHAIIIRGCLNYGLYQISSGREVTGEELAELVREKMNPECQIITDNPDTGYRLVLSGARYESEFGNPYFNDTKVIVEKIADRFKDRAYAFTDNEEIKQPLWQRIKQKGGWFLRAIVPFVENIAVFIACFMLYNRAVDSTYFAHLDIYLLYVLIFAVVFGQQQAVFSALLAVIGYFFRQTYDRSSFELLLDANTYVWVAQLFIVGMVVGYMRDQIVKLKNEQAEERDYLTQQVEDIQDLNSTNTRVKDVLETQLVNQTDSVGKIYSITSALDQYSPEEVLFYSAETVGQILKTEDVAIYVVSNSDYARLFSSTSPKSRVLGNSIKYSEMEGFYSVIADNKVYINRTMDNRYPLMANAIFENGQMQIIVMVWGLSWENMTLGVANQLVVVSSLIQNAVLRSNRYISALAESRYVEDSRMLAVDSFQTLLSAFVKAEERGLNNCTVVGFTVEKGKEMEIAAIVQAGLRQSDYYGLVDSGEIYAILSNTDREASALVISRFKEKGLDCRIIEGLGV